MSVTLPIDKFWELFRPIDILRSHSLSAPCTRGAHNVSVVVSIFGRPYETVVYQQQYHAQVFSHPIYAMDSTIGEMPTSRELLDDQLEALLRTEREYIVKIVPCVSPKQRPIELQEWRRKICQWGFRVIDHFRL